jgi:hypothetical protein
MPDTERERLVAEVRRIAGLHSANEALVASISPASRARFWAKVDKNGPIPDHAPALGPCWLWMGSHDPRGYGRWWPAPRNDDGRPGRSLSKRAHRWAYEFQFGPTDAQAVDHLCRNRGCVNPAHLEPVTTRENMKRHYALQTHCKHGHEFTPENTYRAPSSGVRLCRECKRISDRRRAAEQGAAPLKTLEDLQRRHGEWAQRTFPHQTAGGILKHLEEEVRELGDGFEPDEAADCLLLLLGLAHLRGFNLWEAAVAKHYTNRARTWGEPDGNGVVHHEGSPR